MPPAADLAARRPVWSAFADFYLDTDTTGSEPHAAAVLAASAYSLEELHAILFDEVHAALYPNLVSVAGEWAGFDIDWLAARILEQQATPRWRRPRGRLLRSTAASIWTSLEPRIRALREATPVATKDDPPR